MAETMTLRDAAKVAGVSYLSAARFIEGGLVTDPRPKERRKGRVPIPVGPKELRELCILGQLRETLTVQELRQAMRFLRSLGDNPASDGTFLVLAGPPRKRRLIKLTDRRGAIECLKHGERGQLLFVPVVEDWWEAAGEEGAGRAQPAS